jgi:hypothetical protein
VTGAWLLISHGLLDVSIHTPHSGRDIHLCRNRTAQCRFNPRRAGRDGVLWFLADKVMKFQSTRPLEA